MKVQDLYGFPGRTWWGGKPRRLQGVEKAEAKEGIEAMLPDDVYERAADRLGPPVLIDPQGNEVLPAAIHEVVRRTLEKNALNSIGDVCEAVTWPWPKWGPLWPLATGRIYDREYE